MLEMGGLGFAQADLDSCPYIFHASRLGCDDRRTHHIQLISVEMVSPRWLGLKHETLVPGFHLVFEIRVSLCPGWPQTFSLPASASQATRTPGV
jgi:hypothetical protein